MWYTQPCQSLKWNSSLATHGFDHPIRSGHGGKLAHVDYGIKKMLLRERRKKPKHYQAALTDRAAAPCSNL
jgi:hypothetical protein